MMSGIEEVRSINTISTRRQSNNIPPASNRGKKKRSTSQKRKDAQYSSTPKMVTNQLIPHSEMYQPHSFIVDPMAPKHFSCG
jgi:hypothetical protein